MNHFDPKDSGLLANPYPWWREAREDRPIHFNASMDKWMVLRHADVLALSRHKALTNDGIDTELARRSRVERWASTVLMRPYLETLARMFLFMDGMDHKRIRSLATKVFTPQAVAGLRDRIARISDEHIDRLLARGHGDFVAEFAFPFPAAVIAELLGVPLPDRALFRGWSNRVTAVMAQERPNPIVAFRGNRAMVALLRYIEKRIEERKHGEGNDVVSLLMRARDELGSLSHPELLATSILLLLAGHETTTNLLGNGLVALLKHPEELAKLRENPALIDGAVEEILRYDSSVPAIVRVAVEPFEYEGVRFRRGDAILLVLGSANRDPAVFEDPDRFDIERDDAKHLTFGHGVHHCIGAALTRLEISVALRSLLERTGSIRMGVAPLRYRKSFYHRGLESLPITVRPRTAPSRPAGARGVEAERISRG